MNILASKSAPFYGIITVISLFFLVTFLLKNHFFDKNETISKASQVTSSATQYPVSQQNCIFSLRFDKDGIIDENLKTEANQVITTFSDKLTADSDGSKFLATLLTKPNTKNGEINLYTKFKPEYVPNLCYTSKEELLGKVSPIFMKINPNFEQLLQATGPFISPPVLIKTTFGDGIKEYAYTIVYKN